VDPISRIAHLKKGVGRGDVSRQGSVAYYKNHLAVRLAAEVAQPGEIAPGIELYPVEYGSMNLVVEQVQEQGMARLDVLWRSIVADQVVKADINIPVAHDGGTGSDVEGSRDARSGKEAADLGIGIQCSGGGRP
jgi:allophanate hydrolase subunit 1